VIGKRVSPLPGARRLLRCVVFGALIAGGCDEGLQPPATAPAVPGIVSGTVRFLNWDSAGTFLDLRLVFFRNFPPPDIIQEVLQGRASVYPPLGGGSLALPGADSVAFAATVSPGVYQYIAIAQQFGPDVMADWRAVGQYDLDTNLTVPSPVTVTAGERLTGIDITVDFDHLPPPPFR
jgi:hypothetical protein